MIAQSISCERPRLVPDPVDHYFSLPYQCNAIIIKRPTTSRTGLAFCVQQETEPPASVAASFYADPLELHPAGFSLQWRSVAFPRRLIRKTSTNSRLLEVFFLSLPPSVSLCLRRLSLCVSFFSLCLCLPHLYKEHTGSTALQRLCSEPVIHQKDVLF